MFVFFLLCLLIFQTALGGGKCCLCGKQRKRKYKDAENFPEKSNHRVSPFVNEQNRGQSKEKRSRKVVDDNSILSYRTESEEEKSKKYDIEKINLNEDSSSYYSISPCDKCSTKFVDFSRDSSIYLSMNSQGFYSGLQTPKILSHSPSAEFYSDGNYPPYYFFYQNEPAKFDKEAQEQEKDSNLENTSLKQFQKDLKAFGDEFLGVWVQQELDENNLASFQKMIEDVFDKEGNLKKLGLVQFAITTAPLSLLTHSFRKTQTGFEISVVNVDVSKSGLSRVKMYALRAVNNLTLKTAHERWDFSQKTSSHVRSINGRTKRVCGMKIQKNNVRFGFLQCTKTEKYDSGFSTCTQYLEASYDLMDNIMKSSVVVYYLKGGAAELMKEHFEPGRECPALDKEYYREIDELEFLWLKRET